MASIFKNQPAAQTAKITVDAEHYCTSVTQMAMAQMYPVLFANERKNKTLLCACPGTELYEMGARMVADLFEWIVCPGAPYTRPLPVFSLS